MSKNGFSNEANFFKIKEQERQGEFEALQYIFPVL